ncbi:hypothetical protein AMECASPLE_006167 [Ameca splendens]|uniref:Uncharacterized protein n=1 Tax=Ameca splendens TaxID=208324 RepID=A0ABV0XNC2_9TELE
MCFLTGKNCVVLSHVYSRARLCSTGRVNKPQPAERALRKAQIDIKDRGKDEGRKVGSINILLAQVNRNTKDNIAFSRTSFNCSVYIKLEESYAVVLQLHFTL